MIRPANRQRYVTSVGAAAISVWAMIATSSFALAAPPIRTSAANKIPSCATPENLMAFLTTRNPNFNPRFKDIARWYRYWGDAWAVRWDYAFFQMLLETNYLTYRRPDGRSGDVRENQNNFAGIGATGNGVPGNRFSDMPTGVHAQIQHLVAYSGQRIAQPIAQRTELAQDHIITQSQRLQRPVTFGDLAKRWAVDRHYARSIDAVATQFAQIYCANPNTAAHPNVPVPQPARPRNREAFPPPSGLGGPQPQRLAGPKVEETEELPWLKKPIVQPRAATKPAKRQRAAQTSEPSNPVRTIWSREQEKPQPDNSPALPSNAVIAPNTTTPTGSVNTPDEKLQLKKLPAYSVPISANNEEAAPLPTFRIAPGATLPEPSRLGGPVPQPFETTPSVSSAPPLCHVVTASYGGRKTLLLKTTRDGELRLTALTVLDGFEKSMFETYARAAAPDAQIIGEYETQDAALTDARTNCNP